MIDISNSFVSCFCVTEIVIQPDLFQTKAIFKVPSSSLMQLDSGIVQLDSYSKYLLISTKTKTYLCDTVNEYYKQIGKKLRDGNFGCCFYRTKSISAVENKSISSDNEQSTDNIKIFCARPGCRLWEADFESKVLCTHQFKESLSLLQSNITSFQEFSDGRLKMSDSSDSFLEHFNFAHLYLLNNNFLITFDNNGFYIVDLTKMVLAFWNSNFKNIKNVKVFKNYIYIWTEPFKIHLISLISLEKLIMKTLHNKQFYVCSELCSMYKEDVIEILNGHENLHLLLILKEKLLEFDDVHLLDQLSSIFIKIEEQNKEKGFKLNSGIYLVSNLNTIENHSVSNKADESVLISFKEISKNLSDTFKDILHLENEMPPLNSEYEIVDPFSDNNYNLNLLYQQYKSNDVTNETFHKLLQSKNLNTLIELFSNFLEYVGSMEEEDRNNAEYWCSAQILMYFSENSNKLKMEDVDSLSFKYLKNAFEYINDGRIEICSCSYPLPSAKCNVPQYSEIGREILSKLWHSNKDTTNLLNRVPYLWKDFLKLKRNENIDLLLPVIMQYSDEELLTYFNRKLTYDNWDTATQLLIKLKKSNCLYCDKRFQCADRTVSWTNFAVVIVQNIGSFGALRILSNYADLIPSRELGVKFYQTCIFTTAVNKHDGVIQSETAAFMQDMHNDSSSFKEVFTIIKNPFLPFINFTCTYPL